MTRRSLYLPPKPQLNLDYSKNVYGYMFSDFPNKLQCNQSKDLSVQAERTRYLDGLLRYSILMNNHTDMDLINLLEARNLIASCLTNMSKTYITSVLYNGKHTTIAAHIVSTSKIIGCITVRIFRERGFAELVFCAVKTENQISGVGANVMAHLKEYLQVINIKHILVYADNSAIGFFEKQGFTANVTIPKTAYKGFIKDYDGATLMHCPIDPYYDYVRHGDFSQAIQKIIMANILPPTTVQFDQYPVKQLLGIDILPREAPPINEMINAILSQVISHHSANLFVRMIPKKDFPEYYKIVKRPMCFEMIEKKFKSGKYKNLESFFIDLSLITENVFLCPNIEEKYRRNACDLVDHIKSILVCLKCSPDT